MVIPPSGTTRSKGNAKAGCSLIASHMQASRYGRLCISTNLACGRVKLAERSSFWSLCMLLVFCSRWNIMVVTTAPTESEPAMTLVKVQLDTILCDAVSDA